MAITAPTDINGCVLWLDASDESTFTQDELTPQEVEILESWNVNPSSEPRAVNSWADKSINGYIINMIKSSRPKLYVDFINNNSTLRFDGNDYFYVPDDLFDYSNFTFFMVGKCYDLSQPHAVIMTNTLGGQERLLLTSHNTDGNYSFRLRAGNPGGDDYIDTSFPAIENFVFCYSLSSLKGFIEGRVNGISTGVARTSCSGDMKALKFGTGKGDNSSKGMRGYLCDLIIFNRALTEAEMTDMGMYLAYKWNIVPPDIS